MNKTTTAEMTAADVRDGVFSLPLTIAQSASVVICMPRLDFLLFLFVEPSCGVVETEEEEEAEELIFLFE